MCKNEFPLDYPAPEPEPDETDPTVDPEEIGGVKLSTHFLMLFSALALIEFFWKPASITFNIKRIIENLNSMKF